MVNNAGVGLEANDPHPIWDFPEEMWDTTLRINLKGTFLGCKYASRQMMKQEPGPSGDRGWIVNMGSTLGQIAAPQVGECLHIAFLIPVP
jgi:NAD(P)-dependent dehydrogenase (short-subunit alcohol dehydrogenase family)